jgi:hypothetical protein
MSIKRPFQKFVIQKIESLFQKDKDNPTLLRQIKNELEHRKSKRSKILKNKIDAKKVITDFNNLDKEKEVVERVVKEKLKSRKQVKVSLYEDEIDDTLGSTVKIGALEKSDIKLENLLKSITLRDFVDNYSVSVRIRNAIVSEIDFIKFHTIYDFIISTDYEKESLLKLPRFGRKSLDDLMFSVESFIKEKTNINDIDQPIQDLVQQKVISTKNVFSINVNETLKDSLNINQVEALKSISLEFFVNNANEINVRTRNAILRAGEYGLLTYKNLYEFYIASFTRREKLLDLECFGRGSLENLTQSVNDLVENEKELILLSDNTNMNLFTSIEEIINYATSVIGSKQEQEIVRARHLDENISTLQEIGDRFMLTRERVRQIDNNVVKKVRNTILRLPKDKLILNFRSEINDYFFANNCFISKEVAKVIVKTGLRQVGLFIKSTSESLDSFLNDWFFYSDNFKGWFVDDDIKQKEEINFVYESSISLDQAISKSEWPITLSSISDFMCLPECVIQDKVFLSSEVYLEEFQNGRFIRPKKKVTVKNAVRYVLRRYKKGMTLDEVKDNCLEMFHLELSKRAIGNALGELSDVLIIDTGTYALYEHMNFNKEQLVNIREFCKKYLLEKQKYTSAFIIFNDLKNNNKYKEYWALNNGHILFGICQDDDKFITRRGFMLGLNTADFKGEYISLTREIIDLMKQENRPLNIKEITDKLSTTRCLMPSSLHKLLDNDEQRIFEKIGNTFYLIDKKDYLDVNEDDLLVFDF